MYEIYAALRDRCGLTDYAVAKACHLGQSTFSEWRSGKSSPNLKKMLKLADFFGVSLDYLVRGIEKDGTAPLVLTDAEQQLLAAFRELNAEGQEKALAYVNDLQATRLYIKRSVLEKMAK